MSDAHMRRLGFRSFTSLLAEEEQARSDRAAAFARFEANPTLQPTWDVLTQIEPRLERLEERTLAAHGAVLASIEEGDEDEDLSGHLWYGPDGIKERLTELVGWEVPEWSPAVLRSIAAYDVAYDHLSDLLDGEGK